MNIKFVDLTRQNKLLKNKIMPQLEKLVDKAYFVMSEEVEAFEDTFAQYCKKKYTVGVNSGTDALKITLMAYGVGPGDEMITVPNSYIATAMVVSLLGAKPVFVDIDPNTHTIDVDKIEKAITKKTRGIIPVHLFGQPADMDPILGIAKKHKLFVLEDACQAHGTQHKGKTVPYGETGAFSFYPSKNFGAFGDGGAIVTNNKKLAEKARYLRNDGSVRKYLHPMLGIKSRLDTIQAAILLAKLPFLNSGNNKRREHAALYTKLLCDVSYIVLPQEAPYARHVYHIYAIETPYRDSLQRYLKRKGIETLIHYPIPIHLQKVYMKEGYREGDFPITEEKAKRMLSLPMFPELKEEEIVYVCNTIKDFFRKS